MTVYQKRKILPSLFLHTENAQTKEMALKEANDTYFDMSLEYLLKLLENRGFEPISIRLFEHKEQFDAFYIYWKDGLLIKN